MVVLEMMEMVKVALAMVMPVLEIVTVGMMMFERVIKKV
jgi:hypothetical protein